MIRVILPFEGFPSRRKPALSPHPPQADERHAGRYEFSVQT